MSLYNMVHGENSQADILLAILGLTRASVPRYRDCYWNGKEIVVYTRTGGGNRDSYENPDRRKANYPEIYRTDEEVNQGPFNEDLRKLPTFLRDEDDDFDCTYASFYFSVPEPFKPTMAELNAEDATPAQKWGKLFSKINDPSQKDDPQVQRVVESMKPMMDKLVEVIKKD